MPAKRDLLTGTLDLLVLKALQLGDVHGWGIMDRIRQTSDDVLQVNQGSLYPALHRLEQRGWITATWGTSENNRRARICSLTTAGRRQLEAETAQWSKFATAVEEVLNRA